MTVGKVTKKDSRLFARTYKFMKKNTDNLTLKDFAELIEFMNATDESSNNGAGGGQQGGANRQTNRSILGMGSFLNQRNIAARLHDLPLLTAAAQRQRAAAYRPYPPEPQRSIEINGVRVPVQPPGGRVRVEFIEQ